MAEWDADITLNEGLVRHLVAGQCFAPGTLRRLATGWDNEVWLVDERWAFRFPRRAAAVEGVELELRVLRQLAPQLPLPIPAPVFVGVGPAGWPFFGAELIPGDELGELGEDARGALARPLGEFLRALHAVTLDAELPEERMEMPELVSLARRRFATSTWAAPPVVFELLDAAAELPPLAPSVVCHGDLHFRHLLVRDGALTGVIDWGDLCRGDAAVDLMAYWLALPASARPECLRAYGHPLREDQLVRARVWALVCGAGLLEYALDVGDERLAHEARGSLERAAC